MSAASVLSIGDELLIGDTINTNAAFIGRILRDEGMRLERVVTVGDDAEAIRRAVEEELQNVPLVITTGGLGPTHDDVTRKALFDWFGRPLKVDPRILAFIEKIFAARGLPVSDSNRDLALVPDGADVLFNRHGSAPGLWLEKGSRVVAMLPGVPHEMRHLMQEQVVPRLGVFQSDRERTAMIYLQTAGEAESVLSEQFIGDLTGDLARGLELAFLPRSGAVTLRLGLGAAAASSSTPAHLLETFRGRLLDRIGFCVFGEGRQASLPEAVGAELSKRGWTFAAAESCTGGALLDALTDIPGSSGYLAGGVVAYANDVKINQLGVRSETLERHGAVSFEAAMEMAEGVAGRLGADAAVAITGIAGPGGGTEAKPVGLVWVALLTPEERFALQLRLTRDRLVNKERAVTIALEALRRTLVGVERMPYGLPKVTP